MFFKIIRTANDVEDLSITFGAVAILVKLDIEIIRIRDKKSYYEIEVEEFDVNDISKYGYRFHRDEKNEYEIENFNSCTPMMNLKKEVTENAPKIEEFIKNLGTDVFNYFSTINKEKAKEIKKTESALFCGNVHYSAGIRINGNENSIKVEKYKKYLSILGWINYVKKIQLCKKNSIEPEKFIYLIPRIRDVEELHRITWIYRNKETGEIKEKKLVGDESINTALANLNLSILEYEAGSEGYYGYYALIMTPTRNKPMIDNIKEIKFLDKTISFELREYCKNKLRNKDFRYEMADYILDMNKYSNLSNLIRKISKKDFYKKDGKTKISYINEEISEEMISLQCEEVVEIYKDEAIKKLGSALNRLLRDNKGYEVQVKFLNSKKPEVLMDAIKLLVMMYSQKYISKKGNKIKLLNEKENNKLLSLLEKGSKNISQVIADAILFNSRIFVNFEDDEKEITEGDNEQLTIEQLNVKESFDE